MSTAGIIFIVVAAFVGFEALKLIRDSADKATASADSGSVPTNAALARDAQSAQETTLQWARDNHIDPAFIFALIDHESGWNAVAKDPTSNSRGYLQINLDAHPDVTRSCAENITCSLNYWGPHIIAEYNRLGGNAAFESNPTGFLQSNVPIIQGSIRWTADMARVAYNNALREIQGVRAA